MVQFGWASFRTRTSGLCVTTIWGLIGASMLQPGCFSVALRVTERDLDANIARSPVQGVPSLERHANVSGLVRDSGPCQVESN